MTARKKKSNTDDPFEGAVEVSPAELIPVELDPEPESPEDAICRRISEFHDTLPELTYRWRKGDPAPEWMGPRPVWAEDHWSRDGRFLPATCFWQSEDIELPAEFMYGTISDDRDWRTMGVYRAYLRQEIYERAPRIGVDYGKPWKRQSGESFHLKLTLPETRQLIEALQLLVDIAETGDEQ